jgi:hypothetical protein
LALGIKLLRKRLVGLDPGNALEYGGIQMFANEVVLEVVHSGLLHLVGIEKTARDLLADELPHLFDRGGGTAVRHQGALAS